MSRTVSALARGALVSATVLAPTLVLARSLLVLVGEPRAAPAGVRGALIAAIAIATALALASLAVELQALRRGRPRGSAWSALGRAFVLGVGSWAVVVASQTGDYAPWRVDLALALGLAVHAALLLAQPWLGERLDARARRVLWIAAVELTAAVVLLEIGLRIAARASGLQLLQSARFEAERVVREAHLPPYGSCLGGTLNARGYLDEDFGPRVPGRARVLVIGDSFSSGPLPYTHHYTAFAERELDGVEILNVGVPRIGPDEYLVLLRDEGLALQPDLVVVAFFVGNDLLDARLRRAGESLARLVFDRRQCLVFEVPRRLWLLRGQELPETPVAGDAFVPLEVGEAERSLPFLTDPLLEVPSFGEQAFREIERKRVEFQELATTGDHELAFAPLLELRALAGTIPVALLLLPDEFQVEEDVWREACEDLGHVPAERDRHQAEFARLAEAARMPLRDTLPALRAVEPLADGRRHLYHLRDTHLNARGSRVVGGELAALVRELLPRAPRIER